MATSDPAALIKAALEADGTLTGILTGGVFQVREIKRTQSGTPPFDANGVIQPCANVIQETETPAGPYDAGSMSFVVIHFLEAEGQANINPAMQRAFEILNRNKVGTAAAEIWQVRWIENSAFIQEPALLCSLRYSRYAVYRKMA